MRVGIVGATGFLGGEVVRLVAQHPHVQITALMGKSSAGKQMSEVRPGLVGPADGLIEAYDPDVLAERCDLVFLALHHGFSGVVGDQLLARGLRVIDLGSDFRLLEPADHVRYYGREPAAPNRLPEAVYSLPEITGAPDPSAKLIANPGCFATAMALTLAPIAPKLSGPVHIFGVTGSSGSGIAPKLGTHHSLRPTNFVAYKPLTHQHLGEVRQLLAGLGDVPDITFVPHSAPMVRGIALTTTFRKADLSGNALELYQAAYGDKALVSIHEGPVPLGGVIGTVRTRIGVSGDSDTVVVHTAIDNLLKGGSGQAVQNMNLWMGWPETTGLPILGSWP